MPLRRVGDTLDLVSSANSQLESSFLDSGEFLAKALAELGFDLKLSGQWVADEVWGESSCQSALSKSGLTFSL